MIRRAVPIDLLHRLLRAAMASRSLHLEDALEALEALDPLRRDGIDHASPADLEARGAQPSEEGDDGDALRRAVRATLREAVDRPAVVVHGGRPFVVCTAEQHAELRRVAVAALDPEVLEGHEPSSNRTTWIG